MTISSTPNGIGNDMQRAPAAASVERRRHARVELETEVKLGDHTTFYTGFSEDISSGGLFVATYALEPLGTQIALKFTLPDGQEVSVAGVVRWLRDPRHMDDSDTPPGMGIEFGELSPADRAAIEEFVKISEPLFHE